jgi:ATP-dependent RNA helicase DDX42
VFLSIYKYAYKHIIFSITNHLFPYRAGNQEQVKKEEETVGVSFLPDVVSGQDEIDYDSYLADLDKSEGNGDEEISYDEDGFPISKVGKKEGEKSVIEPLPVVDHSKINYKSFKKNFYKENAEISKLTEDQIALLREKLEVSVLGSLPPKPIQTFECLPTLLMKEIGKAGFEKPTAIQAQALPIALSGRDLIGLAKTGSGKTLAYVWPMIVHILDQPQMQVGDGPVGLILSPTRELAAQIYTEAKKFSKVFNIRVCAIFGGGGKWEMIKALKEAPEIVVATPGRFIELVRSKNTNLSRCTMVVLDEADRMFEMGFEYQMRSIINSIRPDRQTLLFSATMKKKVEGFARELLTDPIRIVVGTIGQANPDIKQVVEIMQSEDEKWAWLSERADEYVADGKVLIFVLSKANVEILTSSLRRHFRRGS